MSLLAGSWKVDEETKYLVAGFVRTDIHTQPIPLDVVVLCSNYVRREFFVQWADSYQLEWDSTTITKLNGLKESAFGNICIISTKPRIHRWAFYIINVRKDWNMSFGITNVDDAIPHRNCFAVRRYHNYAAVHSRITMSRNYSRWGYPFYLERDSVIIMEFNTSSRQLIFYINGKCIGPAFEGIQCKKGIYYKMAIMFHDPGCKVELLNYAQIHVQ